MEGRPRLGRLLPLVVLESLCGDGEVVGNLHEELAGARIGDAFEVSATRCLRLLDEGGDGARALLRRGALAR